MDGIIWNIIATVGSVGIGSIGVYAGLRNKIDDAKDAAQDAKKGVGEVKTQITDFTRFCDERHKVLDKKIDKLENK